MATAVRYLKGLVYPHWAQERRPLADSFFIRENYRINKEQKFLPVTFEHADVQVMQWRGKQTAASIYNHLKQTNQIIGKVFGFYKDLDGWKVLIGLHTNADIRNARSLSLTSTHSEAHEVGIVFSPKLRNSDIEEIIFADLNKIKLTMGVPKDNNRMKNLRTALQDFMADASIPESTLAKFKPIISDAFNDSDKDFQTLLDTVEEMNAKVQESDMREWEKVSGVLEKFFDDCTFEDDESADVAKVRGKITEMPKEDKAYKDILFSVASHLDKARSAYKAAEKSEQPPAKRSRSTRDFIF